MFGDGRLADGEGRRQFGDRGLPARQPRQDGAPRGVGKGDEGGVKAFGRGHSITNRF